jgi:hypothetical protein
MSMEKFDIEVYFTGIHANLWKQFESTWYLTEFWKHNIFPKIPNLIWFLKDNRRDLDMRPLLEYCPIKKTDT